MPRSILIFALCLPLAILMGFMLSDPMMSKNMMVIGGVAAIMLFPLAISMHHRMLIWTSTAFLSAFFVKGQPFMWMVFAAVSFGLAIVSRPLAKVKTKPVWDRNIARSLLVLGAVVVITMMARGGVGLRILGSESYGGRRYLEVIVAIIGFFALTMQPLGRKFAERDSSIYMLGPVTAAFSNIAYMLGPYFYFLFLLFPVEWAMGQAVGDNSVEGGMTRIGGFGPAGVALLCFVLFKWGFQGIFAFNKPWRMGLFVIALGMGLLSGFRSSLGLSLLICAAQFFAEKLHRTKYTLIMAGASVACFVFLMAFSEKLPLSAQRALSFLPIRVDPVAKFNAQASTEWRLEMWRLLVPEIPNYLWLGKGFAIDPTDIFMVEEGVKRGFARDYEFSMRMGDYHNGPLSVLLPMGLGGLLAFYAFIFFSIRALWRNLQYGSEDLKRANRVLFSIFVARAFFFTFVFGAFSADIWLMASCVGMSLTLNGGVAEPVVQKKSKFVWNKAKGVNGRAPGPTGPSREPGLATA